MRVLIVDDSPTMRRVLLNCLLKMKVTDVLQASDGVEALSVLEKQWPVELILTDLNMPNMSGLELLKAIKADPKMSGVPVIIVTSKAENAFIIEAVKAGAANYIVKPFSIDTLFEKINALVPVFNPDHALGFNTTNALRIKRPITRHSPTRR